MVSDIFHSSDIFHILFSDMLRSDMVKIWFSDMLISDIVQIWFSDMQSSDIFQIWFQIWDKGAIGVPRYALAQIWRVPSLLSISEHTQQTGSRCVTRTVKVTKSTGKI